MKNENEILTAQAVVKTGQGRSIIDEQTITTANLENVVPSENNLRKATAKLQELGFTCTASYPTISLQGPVALFEKTFNLELEKKTKGSTVYFVPTQKPRIPDSLKEHIADIVFGEPVETFW